MCGWKGRAKSHISSDLRVWTLDRARGGGSPPGALVDPGGCAPTLRVELVGRGVVVGHREQAEQKANLDILFKRMSEGGGGTHLVVVAAADPFVTQIVRLFQFGNYALSGAFGDTAHRGHVTYTNVGVL